MTQTTTGYTLPDGLSAPQAEQSRREHGANAIAEQKGRGFWRQFLSSFGDPIIKILLIALAINILFLIKTADWFETLGIAAAVFLATFVSTLSEHGSEAAFRELQQEASRTVCRVRRGGETVLLPADELVVGDIVLLEAGEKVPADGMLLSGKLTVDQSALNGESREAVKQPGGDTELSLDAPGAVLRGSVVCTGDGVLRVERVGAATFYGSMAQELGEETRQSPLKLRLANLAGIMSKLGYIAAGVVALAYLANTFLVDTGCNPALMLERVQNIPFLLEQVLDALTMAITVIVVAVPEGLPMMITVVLSSNMKRMLRDNVLVRKLVGIETAGSLNILFTDKTGTLTSGKLSVTKFVAGDGTAYSSAVQLKKQAGLYRMVQRSCVYNTASVPSPDGPLGGNATDRALLSYVLPLTAPTDERVTERIPFDSAYKFSAVRLGGARPLTLVKGAPEKLMPAVTRYYGADGEVAPFTQRDTLNRLWSRMTRKAMRVLAIAAMEERPDTEGRFHDLILIGLAGIKDEIRPEAERAVNEVRGAGVQVVMITGDNRDTAAAIARECGILSPHEKDGVILTGPELADLDDAQLKAMLCNIRVVARALPSDKSRLVRLAQEQGLVAGMTGDGINDAPALKSADVGFAMGSGTEVAKEAGDIVILDNNIASITKAVLYGRTIFKSIRRFIIFQLTMNLCAVGVSIIGPVVGIDAPVTVIQMLWVNIIMDTLGALAFAGEAPLAEYMHEQPKRRDEPILNRYMVNQIVYLGVFTIALCIAFLKWEPLRVYFRYADDPIYLMTGFFALFIFAGIFNCYNARTNRINLLANLSKNKAFIVIMLGVAVVQMIFVYFGGALFRTAPLPPSELALVIAAAAFVIPADIVRKLILRSRGRIGQV